MQDVFFHTKEFLKQIAARRYNPRMEALFWHEQTVPAGEHIVAPAGANVLCFLIGSPLRLEQTREGKTHREFAARGIMQIIASGESRIFRHRDAAQNIHVFLPPRLTEQVGEDGVRIIPRVSFRDERIAHLILALRAAGSAPSGCAADKIFRDSIGLALIAALQESPEEQNTSETLTPLRRRRVLEMIEERREENLSLNQLAAAAGLRPSQFSAQFRATFGMPPHRYVLEQRVRRAMDLLKQGNQRPADVAAAVGFCDQSHLTRQMRRLFGVTPGQLTRP